MLTIMNLTSEFVANIEFRKIIMHATLKPLPGKIKARFLSFTGTMQGVNDSIT